MARTEIQITLRGRSIGLSKDGYLVINNPDKSQLVVAPTGLLYTNPSNVTTTVGGGGTWGSISGTLSGQTDLQSALDLKLPILQAEGTTAAASTTDIGAVASQRVVISGSTGITAFGTVAAGTFRSLVFSGSPLITYNASSLITPSALSIQANPGDAAEMVSLGGGNWRMYSFTPFVTLGRIAQTADVTTGRAFTAADFPTSRAGVMMINSGSVQAFTLPTVASMSLTGSGNILAFTVKGAGVPTVAGATSSTTINGVAGTSTVNPAGGAAVQFGTYVLQQRGTSDVWDFS